MTNPGASWDLLVAFTVVIIAMPVFIRLAPRLGLVDLPDDRKHHHGNVPLVGGLAIFLGLVITLGLRHSSDQGLLVLLGSGALLAAMGAWDDRRELSAFSRFLVQAICATAMVLMAHVGLHSFGDLLGTGPLLLSWFEVPVTIFCVVGITNATNMIDGMDGLSASLALVTLTGLSLAIGQNAGALQDYPEIPTLIGAICGYLLFNLRLPWRGRALAFFGDAGTLLTGFLLAWLLIRHSQGPKPDIWPVTALWLIAIPLMDTLFLMIQRKRVGQSMFKADRSHLHHAFLRAGWSTNGTLLAIIATATGLAGCGLLLQRYAGAEYISFACFLLISAAYYLAMNKVWKQRQLFGRPIV